MAQPGETRGWKLGEIALENEVLHLRSGVLGIATQVNDRSLCFEHLDHLPPEASCSCGFFAATRPEPLIVHVRAPYSELWEVELGGKVLLGRDTFRGETQRVVRVHLSPVCYNCARPAAFVCTDPARDSSSKTPKLSDALIASCATCVTPRSWRPNDLERALDVEIVWAHPQLTIVLLGLTSFH